MSLLRSILSASARLCRVRQIAERHYLRACHHVVQAGPFRGMKYVSVSHCSALAPKIAGAYERELHAGLQKVVAHRPDLLVDIGAAEGYYAVGAAFAGWSPRILAFESDAASRATLRDLMTRNGLAADRIDLREACTPANLEAGLVGAVRPFVIVDAEGFEALLVDPLRVPGLKRATVLLEYHDFILPGLRDVLVQRMQDTHHAEFIVPAGRQARELAGAGPLLQRLPGICRALLTEFRPAAGHGWVWFEPKSATHP